MPRDGSGNFTRTNGVFSGANTWNQQANSADKTITSTRHDTHDQDIAVAMTGSLPRDGQAGMLGNLPMGSNRITGLANAVSDTDAINRQQLRDQEALAVWGGTSTGAANVYEITPTIPAVAYVDGQRYSFVSHQANTGPATLNVSSVGAIALQLGGAALIGGEIQNGAVIEVLYSAGVFVLVSGAVAIVPRILLQFATTSTTGVMAATALYDDQGWWNGTTNRYTPLIAGKYKITAQATLLATGAWLPTGQNDFICLKNVTNAARAISSVNANTVNSTMLPLSTIVDMNGTTDYIEFQSSLQVGSQFLSGPELTTAAIDYINP